MILESSVASRLNCNMRIDNLQKEQTFEFSIDKPTNYSYEPNILALFLSLNIHTGFELQNEIAISFKILAIAKQILFF